MKWTRVAPGLYRSGDFEIERFDKEDTGNSKPVWTCRFRGIAFDAGCTLWEAKTYCGNEEEMQKIRTDTD